MSDELIGELAAVATAVLWTFSSLAWTSAGKYVGATAVSFLRLPLAALMLMLYGWLARGLPLPSDAPPEAWLWLSISGFMGFFITDLCLFKSFLLIGPRLALLIQAITPVFTAIMSWCFLGAPLTTWQWLAMAVTLSGVAWVVLERPPESAEHSAPGRFTRGVWLAVVAALAAGVGYILSKVGIQGYDPFAGTLIRIVGSLVGYVGFVTLTLRWPAMIAALRHGRAMAIVLFGTITGPALGVAMHLIALQRCNVGVAATILATMPVLILPFSIALYGERVSPRAVGGALLALLGVGLLLWPA